MSHKEDHAELVDKILKGARWATVLRLSAQVFSWLSTIIVVRFLTPSDYGLNSMLQSPLEVMMFLSILGLDIALVQSKKLEESEMRSVFGWLIVINGALFLLYFFGGALLAQYYNEPSLDLLAKVLAFVFLLTPFRVIPNALLDRALKFKLRAQVELGATMAAILVTLGLALMGAGVWALVLGFMANRVFQAILLILFEPWFVKPSLHFAPVQHLLMFGGISTASGVIAMMGGAIVILIVGRQLGAELLGIYVVSFQFALLPLSKIMPVINQTLVPAFSKFQSQPEVAVRYLNKAIGIASLALVPAMIGMASIADAFVHTVLGAHWAGVALPLAIISLIAPFKIIGQFVSAVMNSLGYPGLALKSTIIMFIFLLPSAYAGVQFGVVGLALAIFATEVVGMFAAVILSKRVLDITFSGIFDGMRPALYATLVMVACVVGVRSIMGYSGGVADLLLGLGVGVISYYLALRLLFVDKLRDAMLLLFGGRFSRILPRP